MSFRLVRRCALPAALAHVAQELVENGGAVEQFGVGRVMEFRVPLQAQQKVAAGAAYGFGQAVFGADGVHHQIAAERAYRLMMHRHDVECARIDFGVEAGQQAAFGETHRVEMAVVGVAEVLGVAVGELRGQILVERAAHGDIDELRAAADAEHGFAHFDELMQQFHLIAIAHRVARPFGLERFLAVAVRAHIRATLENQAVERVGVVAQSDIAAHNAAARRHRGHHEHQHIARHGPVRDRLLQILQRFAAQPGLSGLGMVDACRNADFQRFGRHGRARCGKDGFIL